MNAKACTSRSNSSASLQPLPQRQTKHYRPHGVSLLDTAGQSDACYRGVTSFRFFFSEWWGSLILTSSKYNSCLDIVFVVFLGHRMVHRVAHMFCQNKGLGEEQRFSTDDPQKYIGLACVKRSCCAARSPSKKTHPLVLCLP